MGRSLTIIISILVLMIAGCGSTEESANQQNPGDDSAQTNNKNTETKPQEKPAFANPIVEGKKDVQEKDVQQQVAPATPNLISSTNPTERIKSVAKGRPDPFATVVPPKVIKKTTPVTQQSTSSIPSLPELRSNRRSRVITATLGSERLAAQRRLVAQRRLAAQRRRQQLLEERRQRSLQRRNTTRQQNLPKVQPKPSVIPVEPQKLPQVTSNPDLVAKLPPPPTPELANGVVVTGVVLVGDEPQAIIKVPNERTSRYVRSGARLASGVLVKRIEMGDGSDPVVVLEQYGIEVAKMVGEGNQIDPTGSNADKSASILPKNVNYVSIGAS